MGRIHFYNFNKTSEADQNDSDDDIDDSKTLEQLYKSAIQENGDGGLVNLNDLEHYEHLDDAAEHLQYKSSVIIRRVLNKNSYVIINRAGKIGRVSKKAGATVYFVLDAKTDINKLNIMGENLHEIIQGNQHRRIFFDLDFEHDKFNKTTPEQRAELARWLSGFVYHESTDPRTLNVAFGLLNVFGKLSNYVKQDEATKPRKSTKKATKKTTKPRKSTKKATKKETQDITEQNTTEQNTAEQNTTEQSTTDQESESVDMTYVNELINNNQIYDVIVEKLKDSIEDVLCAYHCHAKKYRLPCVVYTRHRTGKNSYHLIINEFYVENYLQQKEFNNALAAYVPKFLFEAGFIDNMAKNNQSFALPFCFNKGLQLVEQPKYSGFAGRIGKMDYCFVSGLNMVEIMYGRTIPALEGIAYESGRNDEDDRADESEYAALDAQFKTQCPDIAAAFSFTKANEKAGYVFLNYKRVCASFCDLCGRDHENDNTLYLVKNDTGLYRGCIRRKGKLAKISGGASVSTRADRLASYIKNQAKFADSALKFNALNESSCGRVTVLEYNEPKIRDLSVGTAPIVMLKANKGVGKTVAVIDYINKVGQDCPRIGIVSFRKTLTNNLKHRYNEDLENKFVSYLDADINNQSTTSNRLIHNDRWICQLESIRRIVNVRNDLLIIDEISQVLNQLFSGFGDTGDVFNRFMLMIKSAKKVIVMDADISTDTIELFRSMRPTDNIDLHINHFTRNYNMEMTLNEATLLSHMTDSAKSGKKFVLASNYGNKKLSCIAEMIKAEMTKAGLQEPRIMIYTRETCKAKEIKETMDNVNESWTAYDIVIYSPVIQSGVSFERDHFDQVYGLFKNTTNLFSDCSQMLHRVRCVNKFYVCLKIFNSSHFPTDLAEIENYICAERELIRHNLTVPECIPRFEVLNPDDSIKYEYPMKNELYQVYIRYLRDRAISNNQFMYRFLMCEYNSGARFELMKDADDKTKIEIKKRANESMYAITKKHAVSVSEANEVMWSSYMNTPAENQKLELREFYNYRGDIDEKWIMEYDREQTKQIYTNLKTIAKNTLNDIKRMDIELMEKTTDNEFLNKYEYPKHMIINEILTTIGFNDVFDKAEISRDDLKARISLVAGKLKPRLKEICAMFGKKSVDVDKWNDPEIVNMLRFVNPILKKMYGVSIQSDATKKVKATKYTLSHDYYGVFFIKREDLNDQNKTKPLLN